MLRGDWDGGVEHPLAKDAVSGRWTVTLQIPSGTYNYEYLIGGKRQFDPSGMLRFDDQGGQTNFITIG